MGTIIKFLSCKFENVYDNSTWLVCNIMHDGVYCCSFDFLRKNKRITSGAVGCQGTWSMFRRWQHGGRIGRLQLYLQLVVYFYSSRNIKSAKMQYSLITRFQVCDLFYTQVRFCVQESFLITWFILRYWTYKMSVRYILSSVSKIKSIHSVIFHAIYGAVCIQLTHLSYDDCENTNTLYTQGCLGVAEKNPWLFPDISLTANTNSSHCRNIYLWWFFAIHSEPHKNNNIHQSMLQHSCLEKRSAQENVFNIMKTVDILCQTLCKTWKQIKF